MTLKEIADVLAGTKYTRIAESTKHLSLGERQDGIEECLEDLHREKGDSIGVAWAYEFLVAMAYEIARCNDLDQRHLYG